MPASAASAASATRSGVSGRSRTRTPIASASALAIAAAVGPVAASPAPEAGLVGSVEHMHVDPRHLAEPQDRVRLPVGALDPAGAEPYLLEHRPAGRLDRTALELVATPSRLTTRPDVDGDGQPPNRDPVDRLHLGDHRAVGAAALVTGVGDPAADVVRPRLVQTAPLGGGAQHVGGALVAQVREPERDRVGPGQLRQLVEERLDREHVEVRAERAQRRGTQRHRQRAVRHDLEPAEVVARLRVARRPVPPAPRWVDRRQARRRSRRWVCPSRPGSPA